MHQETILDISMVVGLEAEAEKIECMFISRHHNSGQSHNNNKKKLTSAPKCGKVEIFWNYSNK
jgi:hypothetical protein